MYLRTTTTLYFLISNVLFDGNVIGVQNTDSRQEGEQPHKEGETDNKMQSRVHKMKEILKFRKNKRYWNEVIKLLNRQTTIDIK